MSKAEKKLTPITIEALVAAGGVKESETSVRIGGEICFLERGHWQHGTNHVKYLEDVVPKKDGEK